ncbi:ubiquinol-cytochrome c reductase iron-sulfur subunit [Hymenobacter sp. IS2118]|uniref:QcrA and Rieske domain-containing protein n=1 Tax=Hymenobacter sp. IS2118 TaxID=1505605 RepID=UPI000555045D|nr:Rieske (2Fe-2S) protein [Hymenobacter sp. IS2118]
MKRNEFLQLFGFGATLLVSGCLGSCGSKTDNPQPGPGPTPTPGTVDFTIDVTAPANARLNDPAFGYVYGADNGVIVAKTATGSYVALAAACTHQGTTVSFQPAVNNFFCPNHGSRFSTSGTALNGPASTPLKVYTLVQTGNMLRITG